MSRKEYITVNGQKVTTGDILIAIDNLGHLHRGSRVSIEIIRRDGGDGPQIGIRSEKRTDGWHNLDGACPDGYGYWIEPRHIKQVFKVANTDRIVKGNVSFKDKALNGMECSILSHLPKGKVFVELREDVGGASCDGLGKRGYCVVLHKENIGPAPKKPKQKEREV
ncbi:hypothetical protein DRN34_00350 [Thermococci archaeon]|nr:MAG: hypothetical protein DRN34_00350 [Thermococci archaeon]